MLLENDRFVAGESCFDLFRSREHIPPSPIDPISLMWCSSRSLPASSPAIDRSKRQHAHGHHHPSAEARSTWSALPDVYPKLHMLAYIPTSCAVLPSIVLQQRSKSFWRSRRTKRWESSSCGSRQSVRVKAGAQGTQMMRGIDCGVSTTNHWEYGKTMTLEPG